MLGHLEAAGREVWTDRRGAGSQDTGFPQVAAEPAGRYLRILPIRWTPGSLTITDMSLNGRVAVVTGATKGVGRGIERELARQAVRVFVTGRSAPDHERLDEYIMGIRCDHRVASPCWDSSDSTTRR
jgi:hypothetical protein